MNFVDEIIEEILKEKDKEAREHELIRKKNDNRTVYIFYPSESGYCPKYLFFKRKFSEELRERMTEEKKKYALRGTIIHDYLLSKAKNVQTEVEIRKEIELDDMNVISIEGRIDALNENEIIELKTVRMLPNEPLEHHVAQLNLYLFLSERLIGKLIYIETNSLRTREFTIKYNPIKLNETVEKFREVVRAIQEDKEPDGEKSWFCKYCEFFKECKAGKSNQKTL